MVKSGNTKGGYHCTVDLFDWFGLARFEKKIVCSHIAYSKPVKPEVNHPLVFPG
jgi:hypothetical protein